MIYVDGTFTEAGGGEANHIARWDGAAWSSVGAGTNGSIRSLAVFDDGSGAALYAGGASSQAGGEPASRIARWDGAAWSALDGGVSGGLDSFAGGFGKAVYSLETFRDGARAGLLVGGNFHRAGNLPAGYIARWGGESIPGDLNNDCTVDGTDLLIMLAAWGECRDDVPCIAET